MNSTRKSLPRRRTTSRARPYVPRTSNPRRKRPTRSLRPAFHFKWRWLLFILILIPVVMYVGKVDIQVREFFEGKRWALPARVYARPLELYTGKTLSVTKLSRELRDIGYKKVSDITGSAQYKKRGNRFFIVTRSFKFWDGEEPSRMLQVDLQNHRVASIKEVRTHRRLALVRLEPKLIGKIYPAHNEDRLLVQIDDIPDLFVKGLLAVEDRNFYDHYGISLRGLARAIFKNLREGEMVEGGSTLTQQLVKNFYLTPERSLKRKIREALMAVLLEWHYEKDQILEAYINEIHLGQDGNRSIHGLGMGSRFYFDRPPEELKLHELALLIGLVRAASLYNPRKHPERALELRNLVLKVMADQNVISENEAAYAKQQPLGVMPKIKGSVFSHPSFIDVVRNQLHEDYREEDLRSEGLQIFTTLDLSIQAQAENIMVKGLKRLEKKHRKAKKLEGAMVITGSETGEVLAVVNGKRPSYAGFNRPLNAIRQIGSLVKPAIYLAALENNQRYSLRTLIKDEPYEWIDERTGEVWRPQNYDHQNHGNVPLYKALSMSYNLATVHLGMKLGLKKVRQTLYRMGIRREFKMYPSTLLGSTAMSPLEVAQMYQTIASGGFFMPLRSIREVLNHKGQPLQRYGVSVEQQFDPAPVYALNYAMQEVVRHGTGKKIAKTLPKKMALAGKTGTTNDLRDSWFAGFGTELSIVTWVGRDDNQSMGLSGGTGAMQIWADFINKVLPTATPPTEPNRIQWKWVNRRSGRNSQPGSHSVKLPFVTGRSSSVASAKDYLN